MHLPLRVAAILWVLSGIASTVQAQRVDSIRQEYNSDPVVLTGTRTEQRLNQIPNQVSVISREKIESSFPNNVLQLVARETPGLFLNQQNLVGYGVGPNSGGSISIRGLSGTPNTQVLILINGQPQFMGIFGHPIQDAFMATDIERIEVIQGPASLLYGTHAFGGAINIITKKIQQKGLNGGASLSYGSYNTLQAHGYGSYGSQNFSITGALNYEQTDGFRDLGNNSFQNSTGFLKIQGKLSSKWQWGLEGNLLDAEYSFPGSTSSGQAFDNDKRDYQRGRVALTLSNQHSQSNGSIFLYRNTGDHHFATGFSSTDFAEGVTAFQNFSFPHTHTQLTVGLDYQHVGGNASNPTLPPPVRIGFDQDLDTEEWGSYFLLQQALGNDIRLQGGLRWTQHSLYDAFFTPTLGLNWSLSPLTQVKSSISRGYRNPALVDLYLFPTSNPNLDPESIWNYDLSIQHFLSEINTQIELSAFYMEADNLIQEQVISSPPPQKVNIGSSVHQGITFHTYSFLGKILRLQTSYSYLDVSKSVLYAPRHTVQANVHFTPSSWDFQANFSYFHGLNQALDPTVIKDNQSVGQVSLGRMLTPWLQIFLQGDNVLGPVEYERGFSLPRFMVQGGIRIR